MNWKRIGAWTAAVYLVFFIGGDFSFVYTHKCVRSHQEEEVINSDGDTRTITVCDFYSANAKRWTILDPVRSVFSGWFGDWTDRAIVGGVALWIGYAVWDARRDQRAREASAAYYAEEYDES